MLAPGDRRPGILSEAERLLSYRRLSLNRLDGEQAGAVLDELDDLYREVYSEPPYKWAEDRLALFRARFEEQRRQPGFALVTARVNGSLAGFTFGVTLGPATPWWENLAEPLSEEITREYEGRTFAVIEILVRAAARRLHFGQQLHDLLLKGRTEVRATLAVLASAEAGRAACDRWGWQRVGLRQGPLSDGQLFEVRVRGLS